MKIDCACGATVESTPPRRGRSADVMLVCDDCTRRYAVSVTEISLDRRPD